MEKQFNSNGLFWKLLIEIIDGEVLFTKNDETEPFYYFSTDSWHSNFKTHMDDKRWFTPEMAEFIDKNIQPC